MNTVENVLSTARQLVAWGIRMHLIRPAEPTTSVRHYVRTWPKGRRMTKAEKDEANRRRVAQWRKEHPEYRRAYMRIWREERKAQ